MAGIIKQIAKKARQALGPEPITFLHDKAPCYQSVMADIKKGVITDGLGFDGGLEMAAGKAPDMSYLDAGITPASAPSWRGRSRRPAPSPPTRSASL